MDDPSVTFSSSRLESPRHVIPFGRRIAYSFGHILNDLCASMWFSYLLMFQHNILELSNQVAGNLMLLGQIADAIATPFVGYESDRPNDMWLCKYGRRKAWHLVGTICVALSFPFLFSECFGCSNSSQYARFLYYGAFIVIFQFGWASVQVSHLSLIPDLTPLSCERVELNSLRYAMTVLSNIATYVSLLIIFGVSDPGEKHTGPSDLPIFRYVSLSVVGVGSLFSVLFHVFTKEKEHPQFSIQQQCLINEASDMIEKPHLRWKDWFSQPQFYMVALLYMSTRLYVNLSQVYMPMYIEDTLELHKTKIATIPLVIFVSGFLSSFIVKFMRKLFGIKCTYFLGCILAIISCIWIYVGEGESYGNYHLYGVAVLIGVAGSTLLIISLAFTSDLIANSTTSGAFVFGSMSFVDKLANGVAVVIIQQIHPCISCCTECKFFFKYVLVFSCGGAVLLGLIALGCLLTQSVGTRRNEEQLHRNSIIRHNRRIGIPSQKEDKGLLDDDSESDSLLT
ncbi:major facilitator superfamily domain-containing protein 12-like [Argiope bruennichi]|uniref:major facilitator superfamily domain-containing protein 12-like n=1 Tax=Argiope bruennichi TaxID=94029 RepID=UPI00249476BD|nr:major facilitator superfamily domain-containing protein 12-like [Argiope bruennichi]XP_055945684.1 major facilitator superfamily domain-containing protein 12-like [Argiope bruennichi]